MTAMRATRRVQPAKARAKRASKEERNIDRIDITGLPQGAMLEVKTKFSTYWVVVVDPAQKKVAISNNSISVPNGPNIYFFEGATTHPGSSQALDTRCIVVGASMAFAPRQHPTKMDKFLDTSVVEKISLATDPEKAKMIIEKATASAQ